MSLFLSLFPVRTYGQRAGSLLAVFCLGGLLPLQAFDWQTGSVRGREYVTLQSFCTFYKFAYQRPSGDIFRSSNGQHTIQMKNGSAELYLDGVHYVMSFPMEAGEGDFLVSRMDVIKLFDPVLRPLEMAKRHSIRGIVLDPGHGGTDNGAVSPTTRGMEKTYTRDTAFRLEDILRNKYGLKVVLTRRTDVFVDLYERARIAAQYPDYAFVSVHYNSASEEAHGLETYCMSPQAAPSTASNYISRADITKQPGNYADPFNMLLASMVHSQIVKMNPNDLSADRGVKRARFAVLRVNVLPAILIECGFVSNRLESRVLDTTAYRQKLAEAIARGINNFVQVMGGRKISAPEDDDDSTVAPAPKQVVKATNLPVSTTLPTPKTTTSVPKKDKATPDKKTATPTPTPKKDKVVDKPVDKPAIKSTPAPSPELTPSITIMETNATSSTPLNLAEPAPPAPTPGSEKAAPEPEEPPTVTIYPTKPDAAKSATPDPASSDTNAAPAETSATSNPKEP